MKTRRFNKHLMRLKIDKELEDNDFPDFIPEAKISHIDDERPE